jgi:tetratricopeptide (TPR) repeat protein
MSTRPPSSAARPPRKATREQTPASARKPGQATAARQVLRVLLDDEHTRITYQRRWPASDTLVVTFDPILMSWRQPAYGHTLLGKLPLDVVAVRKKQEHFYQPLSRAAFEAAVAPVAARYRRVVAYGSSLGAYAALYFARDMDWTVIASSPRVSAHPVYGVERWQRLAPFRHERFAPSQDPRCRAIVLYDPRDRMDRSYIEGEILPAFPQAQVHRVPYSGHPTNQFLGDVRFIAPFVRAVLSDESRPVLDRRAVRERSPNYFQVLAQACLEHGHVGWADALVGRSIALHPGRLAAHRTRAMVKLAQGDLAQAAASANAALALDPDDALAQSLLRDAMAGGSRVDSASLPRLLSKARSWLRSMAPPRGTR